MITLRVLFWLWTNYIIIIKIINHFDYYNLYSFYFDYEPIIELILEKKSNLSVYNHIPLNKKINRNPVFRDNY